MHTKDILAEALREAGLPEMAEKAAAGYYHDYLSPVDMPATQLDLDLRAAGTLKAHALLMLHHQGFFDPSEKESAEWAASPEGQEMLAKGQEMIAKLAQK